MPFYLERKKSTRQITVPPEWPREKFSNFSSPGPGQNEYFFSFQDRKANRGSVESGARGENFKLVAFNLPKKVHLVGQVP